MAILTTIGIASIISIIVSYIIDRYKLRNEKIISVKEEKYRTIVLYMLVVWDEKYYPHITIGDKPSNTQNIKEYYLDGLKAHLMFARLYASQSVLEALDKYIKNQTESNFYIVVNEMRQDLWRKKLRI